MYTSPFQTMTSGNSHMVLKKNILGSRLYNLERVFPHSNYITQNMPMCVCVCLCVCVLS